jgi:hypothetical protein
MSDVLCIMRNRPLVREDALHEETSMCQTKEHVKSGHGPQMGLDTKTYWPTDRQSQSDSDPDSPLKQYFALLRSGQQ